VLSRRAVLRGGLGAALGAALTGCGRRPDYRPGPLRIATGGAGGVYYAYGQGLASAVRADLPGLEPEVLSTGASVDNLRLIGAGRAEVAFTLADSAAAALGGQPPFDGPLPVTALARLYENYLHVVVRVDGPVEDLAGLAGRRVSLGASGSGTEVIAKRLLSVLGVDPTRDLTAVLLGVDDSAAQLAAGALDAFFFSGGLPVAAVTDLSRRVAIRLLDVGAQVSRLRLAYGEFYAERTIPVSAYGLPAAVTTVGVPNHLVVSAAMAEPLAYRLTRLLFTRRDTLAAAHPEARRLDRGAAISTYPLPLHPGAARYYREAKV
jgi:TRAP transporter TAXI family solute receptor